MFVANRDFVFCRDIYREADVLELLCTSVTHDSVPETSSFVRANLIIAAWHLEQIGDDLKVVFIQQTDFRYC
jgi:hypothetical protein